MIDKTLVLIPARGGSKGIPGKNFKRLNGKPLINYTIETARELFSDENICVSTDSLEIIDVVEGTGLKIPFIRPIELATDTTSTQDVVLHALEFYESQKKRRYDKILLLQPTSPFRKKVHIKEALTMYSNELDMVASVKRSKANPYYTLFEENENENGYVQKSKKSTFTRRQDLPTIYELNGSIYVLNIDSLKRKLITEFEKVKAYLMDEMYSIDIDSNIDWKLAELLVQDLFGE